MLLDIIELTLLQNKALFSSFCIVGRNPFDSSVSFETFFRYCRGIQFLLRHPSYFGCKAKFNLQRKKVTENKLKSFDYGFKCPVNVKANVNFAIHQSKTFVMILVSTFDVSSLMLVKKQCCFILIVCSILLNWRLLKTWVKHYVTTKFPCQTFTILLRVPTKIFSLY